jgi:flagellar basal-body rod protein FlgB
VSFDSQLDAARRSLSEAGRLDPATLAEVHPYLETNALMGHIEIDMQVADMARNALQYQALLRGLSRHYEILSLAVNGQK